MQLRAAKTSGDVAQLGERHVRNVEVVGSSPIISTRNPKAPSCEGAFSRVQVLRRAVSRAAASAQRPRPPHTTARESRTRSRAAHRTRGPRRHRARKIGHLTLQARPFAFRRTLIERKLLQVEAAFLSRSGRTTPHPAPRPRRPRMRSAPPERKAIARPVPCCRRRAGSHHVRRTPHPLPASGSDWMPHRPRTGQARAHRTL